MEHRTNYLGESGPCVSWKSLNERANGDKPGILQVRDEAVSKVLGTRSGYRSGYDYQGTEYFLLPAPMGK